MLGRSLMSGDSSYWRILIFVPDKPLEQFSKRRGGFWLAAAMEDWLGSLPSPAATNQRHTL